MNAKTNSQANELPLIGILGDGQLSMMMAQAYQQLGGKVWVMASSDNGPASAFADRVFVGNPNDYSDLKPFFEVVDTVTLENEFLDSVLLTKALEVSGTPLYPNPNRFALIEDKLSEKRFFQELGVQVAPFFEVNCSQDLIDAPGYLKLAKGGYDGIGTYRVEDKNHAIAVYNTIKSAGVVLFEQTVAFKKELSLIAVSDQSDIVFYPMVETHQESGTCRYVSYPAGISEQVEQLARSNVEDIMRKLDTRGLFAFEFFLTQDDQLILNESAPRPHNSGHITLDLADCSQFENHMRAVAGLELKQPAVLESSMMMVNLLGTRDGVFDERAVTDQVNDAQTSLMLYRKHQSRVKRKMGHINLWGSDQQRRAERLVQTLEV